MKKIFMLLAHQLSEAMIFTIGSLSKNKDDIVLVHIDGNSDISKFLFLGSENVIFVENRVNVKWGDWSVVEATLNLMKLSCNYSYDYCFLISGDDIPVMASNEMNRMLYENSGKDFIHFQDERDNYTDAIDRVIYSYKNYHFVKNGDLKTKSKVKLHKFFKKILFKKQEAIDIIDLYDFNIFKGTQWFTLQSDTVHRILEFIESNLNLIFIFRDSFCPDETFFHSIIKYLCIETYHDPSKMNDALRYIDWQSGPEYPKNLDENDLSQLIGKGYFFARKVSREVNKDFLKHYGDIVNGRAES